MSESSKLTDKSRADGFVAWWSSPLGTGVALGLILLVSLGVIFGQLSALGVWEPWESDEIRVAREWAERGAASSGGAEELQETVADEGEAARGESAKERESKDDMGAKGDKLQPNWATPTLNGEPVASPLLKTWLLGARVGESAETRSYEVGALERAARLPFALTIFGLSLAAFFWVRRYFDTWPALLGTLAFISSPAIFLGAHTLSADTLLLVCSSLAIMAFFELTRAESAKARWLWGLGCGVALTLSFLEGRFFGLLSPLAVMVAFGVAELPFEQVQRAREKPSGVAPLIGRLDLGLAIAALLGVGGTLLWGLQRSSAADDVYFLPHVLQWIAILVPLFVVLAGVFLARNTRVGRALWSLPALAGAMVCLVSVVVVTQAYGDANPLRLVDGDISGKIPLLSFLLENRLSGVSAAADHMYFAMWIREIGFSLLPWIALVPLAVGYLSRAARLQDEEERPLDDILSARASFKRLMLVWSFGAFAVLGLASGFNHLYYPGYLPLLIGVGLMLGDAEFWEELRLQSLAPYAMGFAAVVIIMMLGKDLERFPERLMEPYLAMQEDLGLPDNFSFGSLLKALKYGWALLLATFFFSLVSGVGLIFRDLKRAPARFKAWRKSRKAQGDPAVEVVKAAAVSSSEERARRRAEYRQEAGLLPRVSSLLESPHTWSGLVALAAVVSAGVVLYKFTPAQSLHLSQRGIFEAYTAAAKPGEELYRYGGAGPEESVYLGSLEPISKVEAFTNRYDDPERYFVVMPREQLAQINYEVRRRSGTNLAVLDASSSSLLLASNQLNEGEEQQNFVADHIIEDPETFEPAMPLQFANQGQIMAPTFDDRLELIGWDIDKKPEGGSFPEYKWGDTLTLTLYFKVKRRVAGAQKIFMHIDRGGSRLHGDHEPAGEEFPTNYWLPGDIVKDEYSLPVDSYTSPGVYTIWMGFYRGDKRMKVQPAQAHDGQNRVRVGQIRVAR